MNEAYSDFAAVYDRLMDNIPYDECICLAKTYRKGCFHIRNRYMVDNSCYCICYLTENKGGTAYTVNYAKRQGLKIINIV